MKTYLTVLCLLVGTLALSQEYKDSISINYGPWGVYRNGVYTYGGEVMDSKGEFIHKLSNDLYIDRDNRIITEYGLIYCYSLWNGNYYVKDKSFVLFDFFKLHIRKEIKSWIKRKKLAR
jgi:hypothetical protein